MTSELAPAESPLAQLGEGYWAESRRPLASLVFIAPLLVTYEVGLLVLGPAGVRNGADAWLRQFLDLIGFGQYFLLPILTVCLLLSWHYTTRQPWRFSRGLFWGMIGECILLSICLRLILQLQGILLRPVLLDVTGTIGTAVGYLGAGIYEELLFRLMLLPATIWVLRRAGMQPTAALVSAVLLTSVLFAAAHHIGPHGEPFNGFHFLFRTLAGIFFAVLFVYRGFGIAAGSHAGYDILTGLISG